MTIDHIGLARLLSFIETTGTDIYPEPPSYVHTQITECVLNMLLDKYSVPITAKILDIGCGHGMAMDMLREKGYLSVAGITLSNEDFQVCNSKKHQTFLMDQSFLGFSDSYFEFLWARHVIEHSIFPYFTLMEFARVLAPGGWLYLEVPAPEINNHEGNSNHYSVLGRSAWLSLLKRSGFEVFEQPIFPFSWENIGPDEYWGFFCVKGLQRGKIL